MAAVSFSAAAKIVSPSLATPTSVSPHQRSTSTSSALAPLRTHKSKVNGAATRTLGTCFLGESLHVRVPTPIKSITAKASSERPGVAVARDRLLVNETLFPQQSLVSRNGNYELVMQADNNLVIYDRSRRPIWATNTSGGGSNQARCALQNDGNLVVYKGSQAVWASGTSGKPATNLCMQDDANLVLYNAAGGATWQSGTFRP